MKEKMFGLFLSRGISPVGEIVMRRSFGYQDKRTVQVQEEHGGQVAEERMSNTYTPGEKYGKE